MKIPEWVSIVSVTGTRHGTTLYQKAVLQSNIRHIAWLHHGDCIGADADAHDIARKLGIKIHVHPPDNPTLRAFKGGDRESEPLPYLERNKAIVNAGQWLIATPATTTEILRSGTWSTVRYARKMDKNRLIIYPGGDTSNE